MPIKKESIGMKIGLDLRLTSKENLYSSFIIELIKEIINNNKINTFIIYSNNSKEFEEIKKNKNTLVKNVNIQNGSVKEQISFYKILKKDKNDIVVFFDHNKPILYKKNYILLLKSLDKIYYPNFNTFIDKFKYGFLIKSSFKNAEKIICFDKNSLNELNERFNININKISILKGFFLGLDETNSTSFIKLKIKNKYNIKNNFFIHSSGGATYKNIERLLNIVKRLKKIGKTIDIVFLGNKISKELYIREIIIKEELQNEVHFLGEIKNDEKKNLYLESIGYILPSFYEPFPFSLKDAILFNIPILASNIESIKNIFGNSINYFSPISTSNMEKEILLFLYNNKDISHKEDLYEKILETYNKSNSAEEFLKIII